MINETKSTHILGNDSEHESDYGFFCELDTTAPYTYMSERFHIRYRPKENTIEDTVSDNRVPLVVTIFYVVVLVKLILWMVFGIVKKVV
jgi:hypothetical protein